MRCKRILGEALRRIAEGASMIRTKGEPGTGDVVQAVTSYENYPERDSQKDSVLCVRTSFSITAKGA